MQQSQSDLNPREPCQPPNTPCWNSVRNRHSQVRVGQDGLICYWIRHSNFRDKDEASQVQKEQVVV